MSEDWTIRPFVPDDLPVLHRIREAAFAPVFAGFRDTVGVEIAAIVFADAEAGQGAHLDEICASAGHHVLVVECGGDMAGFVAFSVDSEKKMAVLGLNAVDPAFAGRGIGAWMYGEALARMKALGAAAVEVGTGGDAAHAPARRAYEKVGFGPVIPGVSLYRLL